MKAKRSLGEWVFYAVLVLIIIGVINNIGECHIWGDGDCYAPHCDFTYGAPYSDPC